MAVETQAISLDKSRSGGWGSRGVPLLPASLRKHFEQEALPPWMAVDLKLAAGSTYAQLDARIWDSLRAIPERVLRAIAVLLQRRMADVAPLSCMSRPWPPGLSADAIPWSRRTRNSISNAGLLKVDGVNYSLTFGELFGIPGAGVTTVLDFTATLEGAMDEYDHAAARVAVAISTPLAINTTAQAASLVSAVDSPSRLADILEEDWTAFVGGSDPRFPELRLITRSSLYEFVEAILDDPDVSGRAKEIDRIITALPAIRERVAHIAGQPLENMLRDLLARTGRLDAARVHALCNRLGWSGRPPQTLEAVGQQLGVTRERVRQLESKVLKALPKQHPVYAPQVDRAVVELKKSVPLSLEAAASLLVEHGISNAPFHPDALIAVANLFGREHELAITAVRGMPFLISTSTQEPVRVVGRLVRKLTGMSGAFSVYQLHRECARADASLDADTLRKLLPAIPKIIKLDGEGDWWRLERVPTRRDRFYNLILKMLSVASPQSLRSLREGISRVYRWRSSTSKQFRDLLIVPPLHVMRAILQTSADVEVHGDMVSARGPLNYKVLVGDAERILVDVLRSSATGLLDRTSLARQCTARGLNEATFGVLTSYSPLIEHPTLGVWKLRGTVVDPAAVEAVRLANRDAPRERRVLNYGWTRDGQTWIAARVPEFPKSMVVGIPAPLIDFLAGKKFAALFADDMPCGSIVSTEKKTSGSNTLYGFAPFLRMAALDEGDVMKMTFNLQTGSAFLEAVDESSLED